MVVKGTVHKATNQWTNFFLKHHRRIILKFPLQNRTKEILVEPTNKYLSVAVICKYTSTLVTVILP